MKNIEIVLGQNEEKILPLLLLGSSEEINLKASLAGRGAKLSIYGALVLRGEDNLKLNITIDHKSPDTFSNTLIKSALTDRATGNFTGLVRIKKGAKNTNTFFREDALLLSKTAKAEAIPSLEIDENEVKAGHASTVGPVDSEQLFYLTSKGITLEDAKRLIVQGYFTPVLEVLPEQEIYQFNNFLSKKFKI